WMKRPPNHAAHLHPRRFPPGTRHQRRLPCPPGARRTRLSRHPARLRSHTDGAHPRGRSGAQHPRLLAFHGARLRRLSPLAPALRLGHRHRPRRSGQCRAARRHRYQHARSERPLHRRARARPAVRRGAPHSADGRRDAPRRVAARTLHRTARQDLRRRRLWRHWPPLRAPGGGYRHARHRLDDAPGALRERGFPLDEIYDTSDVVSLHLRLSPETESFVTAAQFALMKPTAILINTARGAIVNEEALLEALASGRISAAGLDVFATEPLPPHHPLTLLDNVVLTPHCAGITPEALEAGLRMAVDNIWDFLEGRTKN